VVNRFCQLHDVDNAYVIDGSVHVTNGGFNPALTIMAIAWSVLNILIGLVPGPEFLSVTAILSILMLLRFLMGAAQAPVYPVTGGGTTCNWFPVNGWALPNGLSNTGLTLGAAATGPLIVWLIQWGGWRASFLLTAPLGFLVAAICGGTRETALPNTPR